MKCYELEGLKGALSTLSPNTSPNATIKEIEELAEIKLEKDSDL